MENYYKILNVVNFAEDEVIKASYKALAKKYHPDANKGVDPSIMIQINLAYEVLSNPDRRKEYDIKLRQYLDTQNIQQSEISRKVYNHQEQLDEKKSYDTLLLIVRLPIAIIVSIIVALIGSNLLINNINIEGSWSYFAYIIYGAVIGALLANISGIHNPATGFIALIVTLVCMLMPYYQYMNQALIFLYDNIEQTELFMRSSKEIAELLLGSGVIRMIMVVATPFVAYSSAAEDY